MPRTGSGDGPPRDRVPASPIIDTSQTRASRMGAIAATLVVAASAFLGCTSVLGIDEEYVLENTQSGSGGAASGGKTGTTGGSASKGGAGASAGGARSGGGTPGSDAGSCTEGASDCPAGKKCCSGTCVAPAPLVGCGLDSCAQCDPPPAFGTIACVANECATQCNPGYTLDTASGLCERSVSGTGGATGAGGRAGTGGVPEACDPQNCGPCVPVGAFKCCKNDDKCGCTWAPNAYCM